MHFLVVAVVCNWLQYAANFYNLALETLYCNSKIQHMTVTKYHIRLRTEHIATMYMYVTLICNGF